MTVLVAAATRFGATYEIAVAIGDVLARRGLDVDVQRIEDVADASGYDALVLGSGVYRGAWLGPARGFLERHRTAIAARPTWLFSSGPVFGTPRSHKLGWTRQIDEVADRTPAIEHRFFAGKLDRRALSPIGHLGARAAGMKVGDYRDWAAVASWAEAIADALEAGATAPAALPAGRKQDRAAEGPRHGTTVWFAFMEAMWLVFFGLLLAGELDDLWAWIGDLPLVADIVLWLAFLPWMLGMAVWNSDLPGWLRLLAVLALAAGWSMASLPRRKPRPGRGDSASWGISGA